MYAAIARQLVLGENADHSPSLHSQGANGIRLPRSNDAIVGTSVDQAFVGLLPTSSWSGECSSFFLNFPIEVLSCA